MKEKDIEIPLIWWFSKWYFSCGNRREKFYSWIPVLIVQFPNSLRVLGREITFTNLARCLGCCVSSQVNLYRIAAILAYGLDSHCGLDLRSGPCHPCGIFYGSWDFLSNHAVLPGVPSTIAAWDHAEDRWFSWALWRVFQVRSKKECEKWWVCASKSIYNIWMVYISRIAPRQCIQCRKK